MSAYAHDVEPQGPERAPEPASLDQAAGALRGRGRPLSDAVRRPAERATGRLLGHVRVHDDALAGSVAAAVQARAVTFGGDIALGAAGAGPGVLAHELAHAADLSGRPAQGPFAPTTPGDAVEQAAEARGG